MGDILHRRKAASLTLLIKIFDGYLLPGCAALCVRCMTIIILEIQDWKELENKTESVLYFIDFKTKNRASAQMI